MTNYPVHGGYPGPVVVATRPVYDAHWRGTCAMCHRKACACRFGPYRPEAKK